MAFRNMVTGAECSTGSNPMAQIMKQLNNDRSIEQDRFTPSRERTGSSAFRTSRPGPDLQANQFGEFFDEPGSSPILTLGQKSRPEFHVNGPKDWISEFAGQDSAPRIWELEPSEEVQFEQAFKRMNLEQSWGAEFLEGPPLSNSQLKEIPPEFESAFNHNWASEFTFKQDKGKGKIVELDATSWEEQFAAAQREAEDQQNKDIDDALTQEDQKLFDNVWKNVQETMGDIDIDAFDDFGDFEDSRSRTNIGDYSFEPNNPYLEHSNPLDEGLKLVEGGGSLSEAALAFEAAVQKDENNAQAWTLLGNTQAQNEKEEPAIKALEKAIALDPNNLDALMSLAVSYTNENYDLQSYNTLERWMTAKYPDIVTSSVPMDTTFDTHTRVTDLYLQAARNAPGQQMDPDVQVGLGVLFYGSGDYEKAVDCFVSALKSRPKDYLLWNRLGATLANSGRSEDAIEAYHKALDIKPTFVRARYNLGVSCINIGCFHEAAEHLLGALSMHQTDHDSGGGINVSSSLKDTLRRTFLMMDRRDLADRVVSSVDVDQFRGEFDF